MSKKGIAQNVFQGTGSEGMTSSEVLIYNLKKRCRVNNKVLQEVIAEVKSKLNDPAKSFELCLSALRRRGLVIF